MTKPHKGNGVVILDRKPYNKAIEEIISDTCKFEKLNEDPILKLHYNVFYVSWNRKTFLMKLNMIISTKFAIFKSVKNY